MSKFAKKIQPVLIALVLQVCILYFMDLFLSRDYPITLPKVFELFPAPEEKVLPVPPQADKIAPVQPPEPVRALPEDKPFKKPDKSKLSIDKDSPEVEKSAESVPRKLTPGISDNVLPVPPPPQAEEPVQQKNLSEFDSRDLFIPKPPQDEAAPPAADKPKMGEVLANLEKMLNYEDYGGKDNVEEAQDGDYFGLDYTDGGFNYLWYGRVIKQRVADGWFPPYAARIGITGRTVVTFRIKRDGKIEQIEIRDSSGNDSLDTAAANAVRSISTLPPLPDDYKHPSLGVIFSFFYNLNPIGR